LVFKRYINLCKTLLNLFSIKTTLLQKAIIRSFTRISSGNRPSSPYIIKCGVVFRITKFRTSNLHLPIETGRWYNIPRAERICHLCKETIGDEYHFLLVCKNENIITLRNQYLPNYYRTYPNLAKFEGLLSICNVELYKRLSICIRKAAALL
jgi:hypothetical protein